MLRNSSSALKSIGCFGRSIGPEAGGGPAAAGDDDLLDILDLVDEFAQMRLGMR